MSVNIINRSTIALIIVLFLFLILGGTYITAISDKDKIRELAEIHYEEAVSRYNAGDCRSAIVNANRSLSLFREIDDHDGMLKASFLINKINDCLSSEGDEYYVNALQEYSNGIIYFDTHDYKRAKERFEYAKSTVLEANISYSLMAPVEHSLINKTNGLYKKIVEKLREIGITEADKSYDKAFRYYFDYEPRKYLDAKKCAEDALEVYKKYNYSDGIYRAQKLLLRVNKDIEDIKIYADGQVEMGRDAYKRGDYLSAIDRYKKAKDAYTLIESASDIAYCQNQLELIIRLIEINEEKLKKEGDEYYEKAEYAFIGRDYSNATFYLNKSKSIYMQLKEFAMMKKDTEKKKLYLSLIKKCDKLLDKINNEINRTRISMEAEKLYDRAYDYFKSGDYWNASITINLAWAKYFSVSNYGGMSKCEFLNESINKRFRNMSEAELYYNKSLSFYRTAYFENATYYANKSLYIYRNILREKEAKEVQKLMDDIKESIKKKEIADNHYKSALEFNEVNQLETAERYAREANRIYKEINWETGIKNSEKLIDEIVRKKAQSSIIEQLRLLVPVVILLMIVIIGIKWHIEKIRKEREERARIEAEIKMKEEKRRRELRELEMEREEWRRMIEEEKKEVKQRFDLDSREKSDTEYDAQTDTEKENEEIQHNENCYVEMSKKNEHMDVGNSNVNDDIDISDYKSPYDEERSILKDEIIKGESHIGVERKRLNEKDAIIKKILRDERKKLKRDVKE